MSDLDLTAAALAVGVMLRQRKRKREYWVNDYLARRSTCISIVQELQLANDALFKNFTRMSSIDFEVLLQLVAPSIAKQNTFYRESISVTTRLALTLRFLATGDNYPSLMYQFRISTSSISLIIPEVCTALIASLEDYIKMPNSKEEWLDIAQDFEMIWNFPRCLGALDGKHVMIQCQHNSGSVYFNYKQFFSIVLFALVDANYFFRYVNIGKPGKMSDGGVFLQTSLYRALENDKLNIPISKPLLANDVPVPYVFVADDAFPLTTHIMKPYVVDAIAGTSRRVFNYRLSRARRIVENSFGILANVWRVFKRPMMVKPETVELVVLSCISLHNFLRWSSASSSMYCPPGYLDCENTSEGKIIPGRWREVDCDSGLRNLRKTPRKAKKSAMECRENFMKYFMTNDGRVP